MMPDSLLMRESVPIPWTANEKSAYQLQYSYDGKDSFPGNISSYKDINAVSIYKMMDGKLYPYAVNTNEYKQLTRMENR